MWKNKYFVYSINLAFSWDKISTSFQILTVLSNSLIFPYFFLKKNPNSYVFPVRNYLTQFVMTFPVEWEPWFLLWYRGVVFWLFKHQSVCSHIECVCVCCISQGEPLHLCGAFGLAFTTPLCQDGSIDWGQHGCRAGIQCFECRSHRTLQNKPDSVNSSVKRWPQ